LTVCIISCNNAKEKKEIIKIKDACNIVVKNGMDELDTIPFTCSNCEKYIQDTSTFNMVVKEATQKTRSILKYPLSFIPKKLEVMIEKEDSLFYFDNNKKIENTFKVTYFYKYIGNNAYGNKLEGEEINSFYLKDNYITDLKSEIRLDSLEFEGERISRHLTLIDIYEKNPLEFIPTDKKQLILKTNTSCVDEKTTLLITLDNKEEIRLKSWNDFNCEGRLYYNLNSKQMNALKGHKVDNIWVGTKESIMCSVPKNKSDYFIQLINLWNQGK